jgi:hypothetical protein
MQRAEPIKTALWMLRQQNEVALPELLSARPTFQAAVSGNGFPKQLKIAGDFGFQRVIVPFIAYRLSRS